MSYTIPAKASAGLGNIIRAVNERGRSIPGFISFSIGNPASEAIPQADVRQAVIECADDNPLQYLQYGSSAGYQPLIDMTAEHLQTALNLPKDRGLVLTAGSSMALGLAPHTLCNEDDAVFVEEFTYCNAVGAFAKAGCRVIPVAMDDEGMIPEALDAAAKTEGAKGKMVYLIPNFHNPTGITMPLERRKALYEVCRKYDLLIYEDNPYGEIRFAGEAVPCMASMDPDGRVLYAGSYSKTLSAGLRGGFLYAKKEYADALMAVHSACNGQLPWLTEMIIYKTIKAVGFDAQVAHVCEVYRRKSSLMLDTLKSCVSSKAKIIEPEGGMFVWVTLPGIDSNVIMEEGLKRAIGVVPSSGFAVNPANPGCSCRLNFTFVDDDRIVEGMKIFGALTKDLLGE